MRKKIVLFSFLVCLLTNAYTQVQIQTMLPAVGLVQKNQLWNLVLVNSSAYVMEGRMEMVLSDRQTSQEVMTASTAEFSLAKGAVLINVNRLSPISYNYIGIEPDRNINTLLPAGAYLVCYTFIRNAGSAKREILAEECVIFDVEPLSPPMLLFPVDSSVLETPPAQFTWTPPTPAALLNRLHYEVLITEVRPSQLAAEALSENVPFFSTDEAPNNFITYPGAQPVFEKDKWYAWQVVARDDKSYAGKSEVWVFKISRQSPAPELPGAVSYVQLEKNGAGKSIARDGMLRFYYFNQLADSTTEIVIKDLTEKNNTEGVRAVLPVVRGHNYLQKDISKMIKIQDGHVYELVLLNSAMERWSVMFEVKNK